MTLNLMKLEAPQRAVTPLYTVRMDTPDAEDVRRAALIAAIAKLDDLKRKEHATLCNEAYQMIYNASQHLNRELGALLRGTFAELEERRRRDGVRRSSE